MTHPEEVLAPAADVIGPGEVAAELGRRPLEEPIQALEKVELSCVRFQKRK